jgi:hypothetical protein
MSMIDDRRRKMALDRKKKLDRLREKSGKVRVVPVVFKKGTK